MGFIMEHKLAMMGGTVSGGGSPGRGRKGSAADLYAMFGEMRRGGTPVDIERRHDHP